jgi:hypothetical protein
MEMDKLPDKEDVSFITKEILQNNIYLEKDMYPMADELSIKEGMKIMFVINDSIRNGRRWANGTAGTIKKKIYSGKGELEAVIVLADGKEHEVGRRWHDIHIPYCNAERKAIDSVKAASVCQFPFIAAWAVTIHRSQSLTLKKAMLELGGNVFADGQLYVGLSRVRNIEDLFLNRPIEKRDVKVSADIVRFYNDFLLPRAKRVVEKADPRDEYKDYMKIYMSHSIANDFRSYSDSSDNEYKDDEEIYEDTENDFSLDMFEYKSDISPKDSTRKGEILFPENEIKTQKKKRKAPEGIDKIKIILNPRYLNLENRKRNVSPRNELTLHYEGPFRMLSVHAEYIDKGHNILYSIALAVYELIRQDILSIDFIKKADRTKAVYFIYTNLDKFIMGISELEFYFNIRKEKIEINEDSIVYRHLIPVKGKDGEKGATTYYSKDYNPSYQRKSYGIIYDRDAKLRKDNQTSHKKLEANPYKMRLEFRLCNVSGDWLHLNNLRGNYSRIIKRYLGYLAILYKKFFLNYITIDPGENKYLDMIVSRSKMINSRRYTDKERKLRRKKPIEKEYRALTKSVDKEEKIDELFSAFHEQEARMKDDEKYAIFAKWIAKKSDINGKK